MHVRRQSRDSKAFCSDLRKLPIIVPKKHRIRGHSLINRVGSHKDKKLHWKGQDLSWTRAQYCNKPRTLIQINLEQQEKNPQQVKPRRLHKFAAEPSTRFRLLCGIGENLWAGGNFLKKKITSDQGLLKWCSGILWKRFGRAWWTLFTLTGENCWGSFETRCRRRKHDWKRSKYNWGKAL